MTITTIILIRVPTIVPLIAPVTLMHLMDTVAVPLPAVAMPQVFVPEQVTRPIWNQIVVENNLAYLYFI